MRVLISVSDKTGIVDFAKVLHTEFNADVISSGGTYKTLKEAGIPVTEVSAYTGFPELLDGRLKTLHPKVHGGLLGLRDNKEHVATMEKHGIPAIDMVVVNLYPFKKTIERPGVRLEQAIENIDIGGPSMLRSAAKNYCSVAVIVNPSRYESVTAELRASSGKLSAKTHEQLALEAFSHTAEYDAMIAAYLAKTFGSRGANGGADCDAPLPAELHLSAVKAQDCRYGENPHQAAAFYRFPPPTGLADITQLQGKELSFNNLLDMQAAWRTVRDFKGPAATVIKHTNPCGLASNASLSEAYAQAFAGDEKSAFGGIVGLNQRCDAGTAQKIVETFMEVVIAPSFSEEALAVFTSKKNLRVVQIHHFFARPQNLDVRSVDGGLLVQTQDLAALSPDHLKFVTERAPTELELVTLLFAWQAVRHVKSNAIVLAKDQQVIGVGCGQTSRVEAVDLAIRKAGPRSQGAVMASDAFFPFADSVETAHRAGIRAIIQPGGSLKDQESIDACNRCGISMVFTGTRHFKH